MKKFITITSIVVLAVVLATMLMACTPSEESLTKKYKDAGYGVASGNVKDLEGIINSEIDDAAVKYVLVVTKLMVPVAGVVCFTDSAEAKALYEELEPTLKDLVKKKGNAVAVGLSADVLELF